MRLTTRERGTVATARSRPLASAPAHLSAQGSDALQAASVDGFRAGMIAAGALAILGGLISAVGIENPRRREANECPGGALVGASRRVGGPLTLPSRS